MYGLPLLLIISTFYSQETAWKSNWAEAMKEAKTSHKLAVLLFFNKGVKDCVRFESETLSNAKIETALKAYVCARIDPEGTDNDNKLWQDHKMPRLPMTYVYDPEGNLLASINSLSPRIYGGVLEAASPAYFDKILPARQALAKDPNQPDKLVLLGQAYGQLENPDESSKHYEKAAKLLFDRGDRQGALKIMESQLAQYYEARWYVPARICCRQIAEFDPANESKLGAKAAWVHGMADCAESKWDSAISVLKPACEKFKDADILDKMMFTLASAYMYSKDKESALSIFNQIIQKFPDSESARIARVQVDKLRGQQ